MNNFSPRAQQVLALARSEADRLKHGYVGSEHLLLGLIKLDQGAAIRTLKAMGLGLQTIRSAVEGEVASTRARVILGPPPYTPRAKQIFALAAREAKGLDHSYVGTEHILLGLIREGQGAAAHVLKNFNVYLERARDEVLRQIDCDGPVHEIRGGKFIVYLDVEPQRTAESVSGNLDKVGVSVAAAYSPNANQLRIFTEENICDLSAILKEADVVAGYNILHFDLAVLRGYKAVSFENVQILDLMQEVEKDLGHRIPLSNFRAATLGHAPEHDGLDMIKFWQNGEKEKVIEGCCNDVLAMCALHEYGMSHGEIFYFAGTTQRLTRLKVNW